MKSFKKNIKGAVELSLNLIIMLIIGMVVLGLVIAFVNNLIGQGSESFEKQLGDNDKLRLEDVKSCSDNLCVNPFPTLKVKMGDEESVYIKTRAFGELIECHAGELNNANCKLTYSIVEEDGTSTDKIKLGGPQLKAVQGEEDAQMYILKTNDATLGRYYLTLDLYKGTVNEESVTLTVEIE